MKSPTPPIKISLIVHALLQCYKVKGAFRQTLFGYLNDAHLLRRMRTVCRAFHDMIDGSRATLLFEQLYIDASLPPLVEPRPLLAGIEPLCRHLTVKVGYPNVALFSDITTLVESPTSYDGQSRHRYSSDFAIRSQPAAGSTSHSTFARGPTDTTERREASPATAASITGMNQSCDHKRQQWIFVLSRFTHLDTLTLRINGDPEWPGLTDVEKILITLRIAIERATLSNLKTLCLTPVHAMGIIHLRWLGMGAFREPSAPGISVWQRIDTLDVRIQNPFSTKKLKGAQETMFKKTLYEYLRSFAPTLRCLRFVWLGGDGPSPLTLHLPPDLDGRTEIHWPNLEEFWVGNIILPWRTIKLAPTLAPNVPRLKVLRSTRRDTSVDPTDSSAWIDVTQLSGDVQDEESDLGSSIYSKSSRSEGSMLTGGISRTSRELQFFRDF